MKVYIISTLIILSVIINKAYTKCIKIKGYYCSSWSDHYVSTNALKKKANKTFSSIEEFDDIISKVSVEPIMPINEQYTLVDLGCSKWDILYSLDIPYKKIYQCTNIIYNEDYKCKGDDLAKAPKMCKGSCDTYYNSIKNLLNNEEICPSSVEYSTKRMEVLESINKICTNYTDTSGSCIQGEKDEAKYCGYEDESKFKSYCDQHKEEACCSASQNTEEGGINILNIFIYIIVGAVAVILLVLIALKLYSRRKNKKEESEKARIEALERKRDEERKKYREQLIKETPNMDPQIEEVSLLRQRTTQEMSPHASDMNNTSSESLNNLAFSPYVKPENTMTTTTTTAAALTNPVFPPRQPPSSQSSMAGPTPTPMYTQRPQPYPQNPPQGLPINRMGMPAQGGGNGIRPPFNPNNPPYANNPPPYSIKPPPYVNNPPYANTPPYTTKANPPYANSPYGNPQPNGPPPPLLQNSRPIYSPPQNPRY